MICLFVCLFAVNNFICVNVMAGMDKDWKEFSVNLFDALTRRQNIHGDTITRDQLREFWDEINNQSFHSRLQIFFDM